MFTAQFNRILRDAGVDVILTPKKAPSCNAFAVRFVLSIKSECLDRMIYFGERRLRDAIGEYIEHHHAERASQELGNRSINPSSAGEGVVVCGERLGGLLKCYRYAA